MTPELMDFLSGLATDPDRMTSYAAEPEVALAAASLPEAAREFLRKTDLADLITVTGVKVPLSPPSL